MKNGNIEMSYANNRKNKDNTSKFNFNEFLSKPCSFLEFGNYPFEQKSYYCPVCDPNKKSPICYSCFSNCHLACYQKTGIVPIDDNKEILFVCDCGKKKHNIISANDKGVFLSKSTCFFGDIDTYLANKISYSCQTCNKSSLCYICYNKCHSQCKKKTRLDNSLFDFKAGNNDKGGFKGFYESENQPYLYTDENNEEKNSKEVSKTVCDCDNNNHSNALVLSSLIQDITFISDFRYESIYFIWHSQIINSILSSENFYKHIYIQIEEFMKEYKQGQTIDAVYINIIVILALNVSSSIIYYYYHPKLDKIIPYEKLMSILINLEVTIDNASFATALIYLILNVHLKQDFQKIKILSVQDILISTPLERILMRYSLMNKSIYTYNFIFKYFTDDAVKPIKLCLKIIEILTKSLDFYKDKLISIKVLFVGIKVVCLLLKLFIFDLEEIIQIIYALETYFYKLFVFILEFSIKYNDNSLKSPEESVEILFNYMFYITKINFLLTINYNDLVLYNKYIKKMIIRNKLTMDNKKNSSLEEYLLDEKYILDEIKDLNQPLNSEIKNLKFIHYNRPESIKLFKMIGYSSFSFGNFLMLNKRNFKMTDPSFNFKTYFKLCINILSIFGISDNFYFNSMNKDYDQLAINIQGILAINETTILEKNINVVFKEDLADNNFKIEQSSNHIIIDPLSTDSKLIFKKIVFDTYSFFEKKIQLFFLYQLNLKDMNKALVEYLGLLSIKFLNFKSDVKTFQLRNPKNYITQNKFSYLNTEAYCDLNDIYMNGFNKAFNENDTPENIGKIIKDHMYLEDYKVLIHRLKIIHFSIYEFTKKHEFIYECESLVDEMILSNIDISFSKFLMIDFKQNRYDPKLIDLIFSFMELFFLTKRGTSHFILGRNLRRIIKIFPRFPQKTLKFLLVFTRSLSLFKIDIKNHKRILEILNMLCDYLDNFVIISNFDKKEFIKISKFAFKVFINLCESIEIEKRDFYRSKIIIILANKKNLLEKLVSYDIFSKINQKSLLQDQILNVKNKKNKKNKDNKNQTNNVIIEEDENENEEKNNLNNNENNENINEDKNENNDLNDKEFLGNNNYNNIMIREEQILTYSENNVLEFNYNLTFLKEKLDKAVKTNKNKMAFNNLSLFLQKHILSQKQNQIQINSNNNNNNQIKKDKTENEINNEAESFRKLNEENNVDKTLINIHSSSSEDINSEIEFLNVYLDFKYRKETKKITGNKLANIESSIYNLSELQSFYISFIDFTARTSFYNSLKDTIFQTMINLIDIDHFKFIMEKNLLSLKQRISIIKMLRLIYFTNFCDRYTFSYQSKYPDNSTYVVVKKDKKSNKKTEVNKFKVELYDEMRIAIEIVISELKNFVLFLFLYQEDKLAIEEYLVELINTTKVIADMVIFEKLPSSINLSFYELVVVFLSNLNLIIDFYLYNQYNCSIINVELTSPPPEIAKKLQHLEDKNFDMFETQEIYMIFSDAFILVNKRTNLNVETRLPETISKNEKIKNMNFRPISLLKPLWSNYYYYFLHKNNPLYDLEEKNIKFKISDAYTSIVNNQENNNYTTSISNMISQFFKNNKDSYYNYNEKSIFNSIIDEYSSTFLEIDNQTLIYSIDISQQDILVNYCEVIFIFSIEGLNHFDQISQEVCDYIVLILNRCIYYNVDNKLILYNLIFKSKIDIAEVDENVSEYLFVNLSADLMKKINLSIFLSYYSHIYTTEFKSTVKSAEYILNFFKIMLENKDNTINKLFCYAQKYTSTGQIFSDSKNELTSLTSINIEKRNRLINMSFFNISNNSKGQKNEKSSNEFDLESINYFLYDVHKTKINILPIVENNVVVNVNSKQNAKTDTKKKELKQDKKNKEKEKEMEMEAEKKIPKMLVTLNNLMLSTNFKDPFEPQLKKISALEIFVDLFKIIVNNYDVKNFFNGNLPGDCLITLFQHMCEFFREFIEDTDIEMIAIYYNCIKQLNPTIKSLIYFKFTNETLKNLISKQIIMFNSNMRIITTMMINYYLIDIVISMIEEGISINILPDLTLFYKPIEMFNEMTNIIVTKYKSIKKLYNIKDESDFINDQAVEEFMNYYRFDTLINQSLELKLAIKIFDYLIIIKDLYKNAVLINFLNNLESDNQEGIINKNFFVYKFMKKIFLKIEVILNQEEKSQFFLIPTVCLQLSEQTKSQFLLDVDRENTYSKILSLLNGIDYFMYEMIYYDDLIKNGKTYFKTLLNLKLIYFELFNYFIIIVQQIFLFINFTNDEEALVSTGPMSRLEDKNQRYLSNVIISGIQLLFLIIVFVIWGISKFKTRLIEILMRSHNKSFLFKSNPIMEKKLNKIFLTQNTLDNHIQTFVDDIKWYDYIYTLVFDTILFNKELIFLILSFILNCLYLGLANSVFLVLQVVFLVNLSDILYGVVVAIRLRYVQLVSVLAFTYLMVYVFSYFAFYYLYQSMYFSSGVLDLATENDKTVIEYFCNDSLYCFLTHLSYGVRSGGGIGDVTPRPSYTDNSSYYVGRLIYDIVFHIIIVWIMGNIFFGIIVDTFAYLRDKSSIKENDINNVCYICQISRDICVTKNIDFDSHVYEDHNVWNYVYFLSYLHFNNPSKFKSVETSVWLKFNEKDSSWLPNVEVDNIK